MLIGLYAALSMIFQDVTATFMVLAESRGNAVKAGVGDMVQWFFAFVTGAYAYSSYTKHGWDRQTIIIVIFVTIANFVGTYIGVKIGRRYTKKDEDISALLEWKSLVEAKYPELRGGLVRTPHAVLALASGLPV